MPERFASVLRRLRERHGYSQATLATRAGVTTDHIARLEKGLVRPTRETIGRIAFALMLDEAERKQLAESAVARVNRPGTPQERATVVPIRPVVSDVDKLAAMRAFFKDWPVMLDLSEKLLGEKLTPAQRARLYDRLVEVDRDASRGEWERSA